MNHYETVFILNPVLSDVQVKETVSLKIFLLQEEPQWFLKEDWGLKKWLTKLNKKKWFLSLI
jgi:small subunit ribosomal protein S6